MPYWNCCAFTAKGTTASADDGDRGQGFHFKESTFPSNRQHLTMQIINLSPKSKDMELPLTQLAASEDRLEALRGKKLLELVRYLRSQGDEPEAHGRLWAREQLMLTAAG